MGASNAKPKSSVGFPQPTARHPGERGAVRAPVDPGPAGRELDRGGHAVAGVNQGLCWSMTQTSKLDLTRADQRGLTVGLNEFSGHVGVAAAGILTAYSAEMIGIRFGLLAFGLSRSWPKVWREVWRGWSISAGVAGLGWASSIRKLRPRWLTSIHQRGGAPPSVLHAQSILINRIHAFPEFDRLVGQPHLSEQSNLCFSGPMPRGSHLHEGLVRHYSLVQFDTEGIKNF